MPPVSQGTFEDILEILVTILEIEYMCGYFVAFRVEASTWALGSHWISSDQKCHLSPTHQTLCPMLSLCFETWTSFMKTNSNVPMFLLSVHVSSYVMIWQTTVLIKFSHIQIPLCADRHCTWYKKISTMTIKFIKKFLLCVDGDILKASLAATADKMMLVIILKKTNYCQKYWKVKLLSKELKSRIITKSTTEK